MYLEIYNRQFERIGIVDVFMSVIWHRKYFTSGEFQADVPSTDNNLALLKEERILYKVGSDEAGVIQSININQTESGETITVKGLFLTGYLKRRIIPKLTTFTGTYGAFMRLLVDKNTIHTEVDRTVPLLKMETEPVITGVNTTVQVVGKNLLTYLGKLAQVSNIGFRVAFKRNFMEWQTLVGVDHSAEQNINPRIIISNDYDNLQNASYEYSSENAVNYVYVVSDADVKQTIVEVGEGKGLDRFEAYVDANVTKEENMTNEQYLNLLKEKGLEVKALPIENINGDVLDNGNATYGKDFDLGDIVTVINERWNKKISVRITEVEEVDDESGHKNVIYVGDTAPSLKDILEE